MDTTSRTRYFVRGSGPQSLVTCVSKRQYLDLGEGERLGMYGGGEQMGEGNKPQDEP